MMACVREYAINGAICLLLLHLVGAQQLPYCNDTEWQQTADEAFVGYESVIRPLWEKMTDERKQKEAESVDEAKFKLYTTTNKQQCLVEYVFRAAYNTIEIGRQFKINSDCLNVEDRTYIILLVLEKLIGSPQLGLKLRSDFRIWYDLTDGSVLNEQAYQLLSFPVFAFGRAQEVNYALPVPELYLQYALVAKHRELFRQMRRLTALNSVQHRQLALRMLSLFTYRTMPSPLPWSEKVPQAVYRGSCYPTQNPWSYREGEVETFFLRGEMCEAVSKVKDNNLLDFGLKIDNAYTDNCNPNDEFYSTLCGGCAPCSHSKPLDNLSMAKYKYIMQIDGYGPGFDSLYWKLSSNSVMYLLTASAEPLVPFYVQWLSNVLKPGVHYIPFTISSWQDKVEWCIEHDEECEAIAASALRLMRCSVTLETAERYLARALQLAHDVQQSPFGSA